LDLARFSRVALCYRPTPLEQLENLTAALDGPSIYIKRDDCTGLATGGNKTRKLEFLIGEAIEQGADTVITQGAVQSNHARQTAAAAAKFGLKCKILLERLVPDTAASYERTGNVLLDRMFGAELEFRSRGTDMNAAGLDLAERIREAGGKPYFIPGGGSNRVGALGYVSCALEIMRQADDQGLRIDRLVHATGSAGTQAGLIVGLKAMHSAIPLLGIGVNAPKNLQEERVYALATETAAYIGAAGCVNRDDIVANCDYVGEGYGISTETMKEAVSLLARLEGILADPVYSGKGLAGMFDLIAKGYFKKGENVVFLHTGGSVSLFAYPKVFDLPGYA